MIEVERNDKSNSLCEKSMKMMVNIIKLSSFSIAKFSLGSTRNVYATPPSHSDDQLLSSKQLLLQQNSSKPITSFIGDAATPVRESNGSDQLSAHDQMFAAYINKVHKKNRSNLHEASKLSPYILPPPPTPLTRNNY